MCTDKHHRHSIFCILPPYLLHHVASQGTSPKMRQMAIDIISIDNTFRNLRISNRSNADSTINSPATFSVAGDKQRSIATAHNQQTFPGTIVRSEGSPPSSDRAVNEAYDGLGDTYDFFWETFNRNSIDDEGLPLVGIVHFGQDYSNAFWDGQRMVFGDGDMELFNRFTSSLDVIAHELTHGVVQDEAQLMYSFQSGALNESLADVFGSLVKQKKLNQNADQADWLVGAELLSDLVKNDRTLGESKAIRSLKDPGSAYHHPILGKDPQPKHMRDFVNTFDDNGGVHINSGIPNHAFYHCAMNIGGKAWELAGRIWYETLLDSRLRPNAKFKRFAQLTVINARRYNVENQVRSAWKTVGIEIS